MSWQAIWAPRALKELARLDRTEQHRVRRAVEAFAGESKGDVRRLQDITPAEYRLRIGKWRVRFRLDHDSGKMHILRVLRRDEAY
jgi:mRNA-degrading endonuclease RelE of RelBE toxin-antitoxin system